MKIKINKKTKIIVGMGLVILVLLTSYLLYREAYVKKFIEEKQTVYSYRNDLTMDYELFLKENKLYLEDSLREGDLFITEYVDYGLLDINYGFSGDKDIDLAGDYNILARVRGYIQDRDRETQIWERDFPLVEKQRFSSRNRDMDLNEKLRFELESYSNFAREIIESSKINCLTSLDIITTVNIRGKTGQGPIEESLSSNISLGLNQPFFSISGDNIISRPGKIQVTRPIELGKNKGMIIGLSLGLGITILALIYLIFFTQTLKEKSYREKLIGSLVKKYGDRLVALRDYEEGPGANINMVKSMDDLLKLADEIKRPILYRDQEDHGDIGEFFIIDENEIYKLQIRDLLGEDKVGQVSIVK